MRGTFIKSQSGDTIGFTSSTVINELFHTILIGEVKIKYGNVEVIRFIKEHPDVSGLWNIYLKELELLCSGKMQFVYANAYNMVNSN